MLTYFKNLKSAFLIIVASVGIGAIIVFPLASQLVSDCMYDQIIGAYESDSTFDDQWNKCLLRPQVLTVGATVVATFLLSLWFRRTLLGGASIAYLATTSALYGVMQFLSLFLLQSHYLYDGQHAFTFGEIVRNYWFALDAIVFYSVAVVIANVLVKKRKKN